MAKKEQRNRGILPSPTNALLSTGYAELLDDLKGRVRTAQVRAAVAVNAELIRLYWDMGRAIVERQQRDGWGTAVVVRLATDLQVAFPGRHGLSPRNVWRMRAFYLAYALAPAVEPLRKSPDPVLPQAVAESPGGTTRSWWSRSKTRPAGSGTPRPPRSSAGPGPSWSTRSTPTPTAARGGR